MESRRVFFVAQVNPSWRMPVERECEGGDPYDDSLFKESFFRYLIHES